MRELFKNKKFRSAAVTVITAVVLTMIIGVWDGFLRIDRWAADALFQHPMAVDGTIVVIGIDDRALEELGPYNSWDRNIMASALEALSRDPDNKPAAVAIDTVYTGETSPEADEHLAKAAEDLGCVITASFASIGTVVKEDANGRLYYDKNAVYEYSLPYEKLRGVTKQAHINAMTDSDGILRHALLTVKPDGEEVFSMAYTAASLYAEKNGMEITPPETVNGSYYVSYSALPGGFYDGYSIVDLINNDIAPEELAGKIVFIGPYAVGLQDTFFTSIDHGMQMYGVEYQANVCRMILDGDYKKEAGDKLQVFTLFLICAFAIWFFGRVNIKVSSICAGAAVIIFTAGSYLLYENGHVTHPLFIPAGILASYLISIAVRYVASVIEKQQITRTFARYVAPEIVDEILKEGTDNLSLGGKLTDIAVLFVDVRGFTTMSERLSPEKVVYILNRYLTMASSCVEQNGGTLDKFVGDAMMAFWGAPLMCEDPVYKAVVTAMQIVEGASEVSKELTEEIGEELNVGVGVNFGPAVVGNMGAERHMDYTAIGDTVNTAARLEANAPKGTVYISRAVADALDGRIRFSSLGNTVQLKGKSADFEVLRLDEVL